MVLKYSFSSFSPHYPGLPGWSGLYESLLGLQLVIDALEYQCHDQEHLLKSSV